MRQVFTLEELKEMSALPDYPDIDARPYCHARDLLEQLIGIMEKRPQRKISLRDSRAIYSRRDTWTIEDFVRVYKCSPMTIRRILNKQGPYAHDQD